MTEILLEGHKLINIGQDKEQGLFTGGLDRHLVFLASSPWSETAGGEMVRRSLS